MEAHQLSWQHPYWVVIQRGCTVHHMMIQKLGLNHGLLCSREYWGTIPDKQTLIKPNDADMMRAIHNLLLQTEQCFLVFDGIYLSDTMWHFLWPVITNPSQFRVFLIVQGSIPVIAQPYLFQLTDQPQKYLVHDPSSQTIQTIHPDDLV